MKIIAHRWAKLKIFVLLLLPTLTVAAIVTAAQVAQAVLNSPDASPALKQYADAVGKLALNVESRGDTTIYNGSCCYGILQMTDKNIRDIAKMTPEQYQQLDLQSQVNYWARLTSPLLNTGVVKQLSSMNAFDGRPVDGNLVLACMQLGVGNCQTAIRSGSCKGFADRNGTTICSMADKIATGSSSSGSGSGGTGSGSGSSGGSTGYSPPPTADCIRQNGACLPVNEAMAQAFESGAGFSMRALKNSIYAITVAFFAIFIVGGAVLNLWRQYASGQLDQPTFVVTVLKTGLTLSILLLLMSYT